MCCFDRVFLGKLFNGCLVVVGLLSWCSCEVAAAIVEVPASQMAPIDNPPQPGNLPTFHTDGAGYIRNEYWRAKSYNSYHQMKATLTLPAAGQYNVYVRCHQVVAPSMYFQVSTDPYSFYAGDITVDGAPDEDRWFVVDGGAWAYELLGTINVGAGNHVLSFYPYSGTSTSTMDIDSMIFASPGEGYATEAEALGSLPPPSWSVLYCSMEPSPVRSFNMSGSYGTSSPAMSYTVENGALVATGDMTWAQEEAALRYATGRDYFQDGDDWFGPIWNSSGIPPRNFSYMDSFTLSEWAFAEVVYWERMIANGNPNAAYNSAEFLSVWQSENRFTLKGDPLGDVAYRLYLKFAEISQ